jgi:hypothetical protein
MSTSAHVLSMKRATRRFDLQRRTCVRRFQPYLESVKIGGNVFTRGRRSSDFRRSRIRYRRLARKRERKTRKAATAPAILRKRKQAGLSPVFPTTQQHRRGTRSRTNESDFID